MVAGPGFLAWRLPLRNRVSARDGALEGATPAGGLVPWSDRDDVAPEGSEYPVLRDDLPGRAGPEIPGGLLPKGRRGERGTPAGWA